MVYNVARKCGPQTLQFESGKLAQQANGSVLLQYGECMILVAATMSNPREGIDFFPLSVGLEERFYAKGKIPGSFFRREGRPSTHGTLIARLTDRPLRPLFPKGFRNEVQIVITPLSIDQETPLEIPCLIGASAALSISDIPFEGPIGATAVGYIDGEFVINPTYDQIENSELNLIVAGSKDGVIMLEGDASEMPESLVLQAIEKAQAINLEVISLQEEMTKSIGKVKADFKTQPYPEELDKLVTEILDGSLISAFEASHGKADLSGKLGELKSQVIEKLGDEHDPKVLASVFESKLEQEFKNHVLSGGNRPDGRKLKDIRPISCEVGLLPRTHGSGLFTRGETQILSVATLGSPGDAQKMDTLSPEISKRFTLHYNFPPYSVGETRRMMSPGRREIGHGALAERALSSVMPSEEEFPYTIRLVCEALSSNGSTSMGSGCGGVLALMDAGIPIKTPVAGISIGLITNDDGKYVVLTDIQGMEDHIGDMDFKVAGSESGITAIQLDIKVKNISMDVISDALNQAKDARLVLLNHMKEAISEVRSDLSPYAPRLIRISVPVEKIGAVIGPGGKTIRSIIEETQATVDIQDDGTVIFGATDSEASNKAIQMITDLTKEAKAGDIYTGKVVRIMNFGAFVEILPGKDGLVHISELANYHVANVEDEVKIGDEITVVVKEIDAQGRINLSRKSLLQNDPDSENDNNDSKTSEGNNPDHNRPRFKGTSKPRNRPFNRRPTNNDR